MWDQINYRYPLLILKRAQMGKSIWMNQEIFSFQQWEKSRVKACMLWLTRIAFDYGGLFLKLRPTFATKSRNDLKNRAEALYLKNFCSEVIFKKYINDNIPSPYHNCGMLGDTN